jgi:hypothetical protein
VIPKENLVSLILSFSKIIEFDNSDPPSLPNYLSLIIIDYSFDDPYL